VIVLGFDTSTPSSAVGLRLPDGQTLQARDDPDRSPPTRRPGHTTRLLALAAQLLERAGLSWREIERIAVGVGPGGFTGLRIGVASARGLAQSLDVELVGVSSLRALAVGALGEAGPAMDGVDCASGGGSPAVQGVLAAIDARRGEVFVGAYTRGPAPDADGLRERLAPRPVTPREFGELCDWVDTDSPIPTARWIAVGNGAVLYRAELERACIAVPPDGEEVHKPSGATICEIAAAVTEAQPIDEVMPDYLREPDAEIALERRRAHAATGASV